MRRLHLKAGWWPGAGEAPVWRRPGVQTMAALIGLSGLALILRLAAAQGELWLDEIWSLTLISGLQRWWDVFWRISHDNNHFLNSAWLLIAGPEASVLTRRAFSIALGVASPPVWFIAEVKEADAPGFVTAGPPECATRYTIATGPDRTRNSGWTLYRKLWR